MSRARKPSRRTERGVALLVVLSSLALVGGVVAEFQFNSRVDLQLALNARDDVQAEYNALAALRLRALLLRQGQQLGDGIRGLGEALGIPAMPSINQLLEMMPVECGVMSALAHKADSGDDATGESLFAGDCLATSTSEHTKISVNMLGAQSNNRAGQVTQMLLGLLSSPALERHFQEDDRNGTHAESPLELVTAMTDWIDPNHTQFGNDVGDEDRYYSSLRDSYRAKNAPFDSLAEIQLAHGIDDELYGLLKDHLTIYADSTQIELASAPLERVLLGLFACVRDGANGGDLLEQPGLGGLVATLVAMQRLGAASFGVLDVTMLTTLVQQAGLERIIDPARLRQFFTDTAGTTWYAIDAQGSVGRAARRMHAIFQAREGQFYYYRVE